MPVKICTLLLSLLILLSACDNNRVNNKTKAGSLTGLSVKNGIEISVISMVQEATQSKPEQLKTYFSTTVTNNDHLHPPQKIPEGKVVNVPGLCFSLSKKHSAYDIIHRLRPPLNQKGYKLFICDNDHSSGNYKIALIRCYDEFTPLVYMQTNGINYGLNTFSLVKRLDSLSQTLDLKILGADFDWCEFEISKEPADWSKLAADLYKLCPDIVDQGTGNVEALEKELRKTQKLYLWFD